ncbi:hypothetical protein EGW08_008855 [Elysia chlorotica]|uniref:C3H1-type domain-containing protein n=1 Tax=Elysia chlorotica TaxID=188477 RepID=A0A433TP79_ELYCH|nr:hypothetical protein EGW08_008855 [Elysia chlorotica]
MVSRQTANIAAYAFPTPSPSPPWDRGQALQHQQQQQQQYYHQFILQQQQQQQQQQYILLQQQQQQSALLQQQQQQHELANYYQQLEQQQQQLHAAGSPSFLLPQQPQQHPHLHPHHQQHAGSPSLAPTYGYYYYYPHQPTPTSSLTPSPASSLIPSPHDNSSTTATSSSATVSTTTTATTSSSAAELSSTNSTTDSDSSNNNNTTDSNAPPTSDIPSLTTPSSSSSAHEPSDSYLDQQQQLVYPNMAQIVNQHPQMMIVPATAAATGPGSKDSRWLTLEVCREFQRSKCSRSDNECKFAHPPTHVEVQNGRVVACFDSIKGKCQRKDPPCKYLHPPQHLREQLLQNGRNNLILKNMQLQAYQQYAGVLPVNPYAGLQALSAMPTQATAAYNPYITTSLSSLGMTTTDANPIMSHQLHPGMLSAQPKAVRADKFESQADGAEAVSSHASLVDAYSLSTCTYIPQVCREFQRGTCSRASSECRFAHPADHIAVDPGDNHVTVCMDFVKSKCVRDLCKYLHPPPHLQAQVRAAHARHQAQAAQASISAVSAVVDCCLSAGGAGGITGGMTSSSPTACNNNSNVLAGSSNSNFVNNLNNNIINNNNSNNNHNNNNSNCSALVGARGQCAIHYLAVTEFCF